MAGRGTYASQAVKEYWQYVWDREDAYEPADATDPTYVLGMFPYTSGTLHMGHVRNYAITDAYARYRRMCGDDVLHPMGWDAFGLPAENAAYERFTDPESWTEACIAQMREDMADMGFGYDWSREITPCRDDYYRWNQYFFREFYEAGLVEYEAAEVNWCPDCETVLADAQVTEPAREGEDAPTSDGSTTGDGEPGAHDHTGVCWRCETPVGRRELDQWFFTITDYAEDLHEGLDDLDGWPDSVREIQRNWIGRREGTRVAFDVEGHGDVDVFTTRLDTICGATYLAVSPGHDLAAQLAAEDETVARYVDAARASDHGGMSGVETGATAVHPVTGEGLPVYVAAYVLEDVGTGAVMGVPAHNERDHSFAMAQDIPVRQVVEPVDGSADGLPGQPYTAEGMLVDSGDYDGLASAAARERVREDLSAAEPEVTYRLRDWLISRQRYWGTPIPVVHCEACGPVLVPEEELPVELPEFVQTTGNPLEKIDSFVETECPECGRPAERETDTMDTFVDSSWYFLRYLSSDLDTAPFDGDIADEWLPVDVYVGGEEHATLHLLYIRFFARALSDLGLLDIEEPVERLVNQGTVLYDGTKMSKSKGNVVNPHEYGAETTRLFVLSAAHPERDFEWTARAVGSSYDLQQTLYGLVESFVDAAVREAREPHDEYVAREIDRTVAAATADYERFRFHQAVTEIRQLAALLGQYREYDTPHEAVYRRGLSVLTRLVAPLTPYLGEEMWNMLRGEGIVAHADWPEPERDVADYDIERRLVRTLREDVRDIFDVAGIENAVEIEVTVAPAWKYRAHEIARSAEAGDALVGKILDDDAVPDSEAAQSYAEELLGRRQELERMLDSDAEQDLLDRAAWLLRAEFDADVTVRRADTGDAAGKARPGKPAVHIQ
ncbi:MAG: leucine--tRNA ligase [Halobacteriales archaeon SW_9_67_25]|nr:MAG: leucine--tRNA ligase [Halobacteriales archaeon SW_9_67_25]